MHTFEILAFIFATAALGFAVMNHERLNRLEKKLKETEVIPRTFDSRPTPGRKDTPD